MKKILLLITIILSINRVNAITDIIEDTELKLSVEEEGEMPNIPLIKNIKTKEVCRVKEIETYRYKTKKEYYDDNYYTYIDDYTPDINDYVVYYNKELPKNKEIIKEVVVSKIEKRIYLFTK